MTTLLWFKRDLRLEDNAALVRAAGFGAPVLAVYVVEPDYWALPDTSARQWDFTRDCVEALSDQIAGMGGRLVVRVGDAVEALGGLAAAHGATRMVSHEETGNLWTFERDKRVEAWARGAGIEWIEVPQQGIIRRLNNRDGWAARREAVIRQAVQPVPRAAFVSQVDGDGLPGARGLGMEGACPHRQRGGRGEALACLESFLSERGQTYRRAMSSPVVGERACSRLSPHFALGTLSPREVVQATQRRKAEVKGTRTGWSGSLTSFTARLAWRDHFMQKLEDQPDIETHCLHRAYEGLRPHEPDAVRLAAWEAGETGIPFVDACMRYLNATGWLNFRMRSMLMAVASYHLWLDWRATGAHLARMFTDYEPGIHWSQAQMQSGTTGMNTVRIYNPVKQGHDQDPSGVFTRRWVPELDDVPDAHLQTPWTWEGAGRLLGVRYPEPVVDVASAAKEARQKVWAVRRGSAFRAEAQAIVKKHASRKRDRGFQRDAEPKPAPAQLKMDL